MNVFALLLPVLLLLQLFLWPDTAVSQVATQPASTTEQAIQQTELPWRDLQDLVTRVKGVSPDAAYTPTTTSTTDHQVGERATFWIADETNDTYVKVNTTLKVVTPHAYMYLADDANVDQATLEAAAKVFEDKVYAGDRHYFGEEPSVGLDGDPHVSIVNADIPGLGGYFTSVDEYPRSVHPYSNERKAIYINVVAARPGSTTYYGILAHEFEHMIQWHTSRVEESWVKEGSAEVATEAANLGGNSGAVQAFEAEPDTQLDAWADSNGDVMPHYGAAYLFISYFLQHFGGYSSAADLLTGDTKGPDSFDRFLASHGYKQTFDDVFDDWVVANYLDESGTKNPQYLYDKLKVQVPPTDRITGPSGWQDRTVDQFAADYLDLSGSWSDAKIHFQGDQTTRVIAPAAHSGSHFWWSDRGDLVDTRLTHIFDLRKLSKATLNFWAWYDLEDGYDYAYVMVSRDGGLTWTPLKAADTTSTNPNGNNLGNGFTGKSGGGNDARWERESVDLSPYTGGVVLVRFEQVTDDAYNGPGFAVDDISIPELGYSTDAENDDGGWLPMGFIRTDGQLSQRFSLQLIEFGDQITVKQLQLPASDSMDVDIPNPDGKLRKAVLVVSALTRYTTQPAHYRYSVETTP